MLVLGQGKKQGKGKGKKMKHFKLGQRVQVSTSYGIGEGKVFEGTVTYVADYPSNYVSVDGYSYPMYEVTEIEGNGERCEICSTFLGVDGRCGQTSRCVVVSDLRQIYTSKEWKMLTGKVSS